jgi:hypothetical protein
MVPSGLDRTFRPATWVVSSRFLLHVGRAVPIGRETFLIAVRQCSCGAGLS